MKQPKYNNQRAKNAITLIWIVLVFKVLSIISGVFQYNLLQYIANGGSVSYEAAFANDAREVIIAILLTIAYLISVIFFIMWFRRSYYNLHQNHLKLSYSEGWAAGAWFVPIVNLYMPYEIMKELYKATRKLLSQAGATVENLLLTKILGWWWALWIINGVLGQFVFHISKSSQTINDLIITTFLGMGSEIFGLILSFVTIKVIKDYNNAELLLNELTEVAKSKEV